MYVAVVMKRLETLKRTFHLLYRVFEVSIVDIDGLEIASRQWQNKMEDVGTFAIAKCSLDVSCLSDVKGVAVIANKM